MIRTDYLSIQDCRIDTVVFDFDGTLTKLNINFDQMRQAIYRLIARYGIGSHPFQNMFILEIINEASALLNKSFGDSSSSFKKEAMKIIEAIELEAAKKGELFPNSKALLRKLGNRSLRTGIITRNCSTAVHTVFPDVEDYCPVVVCRDDIDHVKPHPAHLTYTLSQLGGCSKTAIMIGDHPLDIETGQKAGTLTAGVLTGQFKECDFLQAGATIILPQASYLLNY